MSMDNYRNFMKEETFCYSPRYAKERVLIHDSQLLIDSIAERGALIAFMHYGSFFLMGGAIRHQLNLPYTAIASRRNLSLLSPSEKAIWQEIHRRSGDLYEKPLFFSDEQVLQSIRWLEKPKNLLGVALDVHEIEYPQKRQPFEFLGRQVFLPIAPARLAKLAKVPMVPAIMRFDAKTATHHLQFFSAVQVIDSPTAATQQVLTALERQIGSDPHQQFFDIAQAFSTID
jgi:lauroyl/myristoyl acyltransferase